MNIRIEPDHKRVVVLHGTRLLGELIYQIQTATGWLNTVSFAGDGQLLRVSFGHVEIEDRFRSGESSLEITRVWRIEREGQYRLFIDYRVLEPELSQWIVPANRLTEPPADRPDLPIGGLRAGWAFDERRMPFPAAVFHGDERVQSVSIQPGRAEPASIKCFQSERYPATQIAIPALEEPRSLTGPIGAAGTAAEVHWLAVTRRMAGTEISRLVRITSAVGVSVPRTVGRLHRLAWEQDEAMSASRPEPTGVRWTQIVRLRLRYLRSLILRKAGHGLTGVRIDDRSGRVLLTAAAPGSSLDAARALAMIAQLRGGGGELEESLQIARFFLGGKRPNGEFLDAFEEQAGWISLAPRSTDALTGAVNLAGAAAAMVAMIGVYTCLRRARQDHVELVRMAAEVGDLAVRNQLKRKLSGAFPGLVSTAKSGPGSDIDPARTVIDGSACVSLLCALEHARGRNSFRAASLKRAAGFYRELAESATLRADRDGALWLLRALIDLYELRRRREDLSAAQAAAGHLLGWVWTYNVGGLSHGGTRVTTRGLASPSTERKYLDFEGWPIARELLRLHLATGDSHYERVAIAALAASAQLIAGYDLRARKPKGWQPAELDHTDWSGIRRVRRRPGEFGGERAGQCARGTAALLDVARDRPDLVAIDFSRL